MSREFSIRVSRELADWVRQQGPAGDVIGRLESAAYCGRLRAGVPDPGPGPERLTARIPEDALPEIRRLTHSRDNLAGLRKLILAGYQALTLPSVSGTPRIHGSKTSSVVLGGAGDIATMPFLFRIVRMRFYGLTRAFRLRRCSRWILRACLWRQD